MMAKDLIIVLEHTILPGRYADYSLSSAAMEKLFTKAGAFSRQGSSTDGQISLARIKQILDDYTG